MDVPGACMAHEDEHILVAWDRPHEAFRDGGMGRVDHAVEEVLVGCVQCVLHVMGVLHGVDNLPLPKWTVPPLRNAMLLLQPRGDSLSRPFPHEHADHRTILFRIDLVPLPLVERVGVDEDADEGDEAPVRKPAQFETVDCSQWSIV